MIDKNNYHTFQPLLYQVATFGLEPEPDSIAKSIRTIINNYYNFFLRLAKVNFIDLKTKIIFSNMGELYYDYLILATGSKTNFLGKPMKTLEEAFNFRNCILQRFESALYEKKYKKQCLLMNFVLAGSLAELKDPELDNKKIKIHLIQATKRLLDGMSESSYKKALKYLKNMGVNVWLNNPVKDYDGKILSTNKGKLKSINVIWTAGVKGALIKGLKKKYLANNRIQVYLANNRIQVYLANNRIQVYLANNRIQVDCF